MKNSKLNILAIIILLLSGITSSLFGQKIVDDYSSWNAKRPARKCTRYIVLHTTEGNDKSSLCTVKKQGTCNYLVLKNGQVHRIISVGKVAKHAGRSMWNHYDNLSACSIGIEVVGEHDKKPTAKQLEALKTLLAQLKKMYALHDQAIVTHSMIAYGSPNRWFHYSHRGRKRCGMLFATAEIRKAMGLSNTFTADPDVKAGRLINADKYLASVLYGKKKSATISDKPVKGVNKPTTDKNDDSFEGFETLNNGETPYSIAGVEYKLSSTIYFFADGKIRQGSELTKKQLDNIPIGTKILVGYIYGGKVTACRTAYFVTKEKWDDASTFYRFPDGTVKTGEEIDDNCMPDNTIVLFRK